MKNKRMMRKKKKTKYTLNNQNKCQKNTMKKIINSLKKYMKYQRTSSNHQSRDRIKFWLNNYLSNNQKISNKLNKYQKMRIN